METIIYVYRAAEEETKELGYCSRTVPMKGYDLIRLGLGREFWKLMREPELSEVALKSVRFRGEKKFSGRGRQFRRQKRERESRERNRRRFLEEVLSDPCNMSFFCRERLPYLDGWTFRGYLEEEWVLHMMRHGERFCHFLILGKAQCLSKILLLSVRKLKSLTWILPERQWGEKEQELAEELEEEYGLAVVLQLLEREEAYGNLSVVCRAPLAVLDFCGQERVILAGVPEGSAWIDMTSLPARREYVEKRGSGFAYFSLEKEWEGTGYRLDTCGENVYNTEVNEGNTNHSSLTFSESRWQRGR